MADEATRNGDTTKATEYTSTAEAIRQPAHRQGEGGRGPARRCRSQSTQAADQAKAAVQQNSRVLQQKLSEKQKLLSQLDQAKMQEQMNTAMSSLTETGRRGRADPRRGAREDRGPLRQGQGHVGARATSSVESKMLEVEQASMNVEAQARLSEIRSKLGIADAAGVVVGARTAAPEGAPQTSTGGTESPA